MASYPVRVITPERILLEGEFESLTVRIGHGDAMFLANHAHLVSLMAPGEATLTAEDGATQMVAVHGGFIHVHGGEKGVTLLPPVAELSDEIDVERARAAQQAAESRVAGLGTPSEDDAAATAELADAQAALERAQVRLRLTDASS